MTDENVPVRRIPVFAVLPPRTMLLDVAGPMEVLRRANVVQDAMRFDAHYVGPAPSLRSSIGLDLIGIEPLPAVLPDEAMIVLAGQVDSVMPLADRVLHDAAGRGGDSSRDARDARDAAEDAADDAAIVEWLRATVRPGHTLVSICSGALLAARAGLLDGRACTTHHSACAELTALAPKARVLENRLFVEDGDCFTSAGVTSGIDLMLHLLARLTSPACAIGVARYLVVYLRRNGSDPQLSPWLEGRNHLHPAVHRVQDAIAADPARGWTLDELADVAAASPRHLSRLFAEHVGMGITDYRNRLRVALAHEMLRHTRLDMEQVAERAGFASTRQLRRVWGSVYDTSPREARPS